MQLLVSLSHCWRGVSHQPAYDGFNISVVQGPDSAAIPSDAEYLTLAFHIVALKDLTYSALMTLNTDILQMIKFSRPYILCAIIF